MLIVCAFPKYTPRTAPGGWFWVWRRGGVMYHRRRSLEQILGSKMAEISSKMDINGCKSCFPGQPLLSWLIEPPFLLNSHIPAVLKSLFSLGGI